MSLPTGRHADPGKCECAMWARCFKGSDLEAEFSKHHPGCEMRDSPKPTDRHSIGDMLFPFDCTDLV